MMPIVAADAFWVGASESRQRRVTYTIKLNSIQHTKAFNLRKTEAWFSQNIQLKENLNIDIMVYILWLHLPNHTTCSDAIKSYVKDLKSPYSRKNILQCNFN